MMRRFMQAVLHPERFHGDLFRPPFFEGWYFKLVTADQSRAFAIIPGLSISKDESGSHAFIQVLDGNTGEVHVARYPVSSFRNDPKRFNIAIGENHFSLDGISIHLNGLDGFFSLRTGTFW